MFRPADGGRGALPPPRSPVPVTAFVLVAAGGAVLPAPRYRSSERRLSLLPMSFSMKSYIFDVTWRGQHQRQTAASGAAGAADAVDIVIGMDGHVEIEDVADAGMSRPRAATSEATSILSSPARNLSSVLVRTIGPGRRGLAAASKPCLASDLATMSTSRLRLQKTMAFLTYFVLADQAAQRLRLAQSSAGIATSSWVMVSAVVAAATLRSGRDRGGTAR